ncbi:hypothetical protein [Geodermatophilus sp. SYSU D00079]
MNDGHVLVERRIDPPRHVEVDSAGRWWPAIQHAWRMYDDGTGWRAAVRYVAAGSDGDLVSRDVDVPRERIRDRIPRRRTWGALIPRRHQPRRAVSDCGSGVVTCVARHLRR